MFILIPKEYGYGFVDLLIGKIIKDLLIKIDYIDFTLLNLWMSVEFGLKSDDICKSIILFSINNIQAINMSNYYKIQFNSVVRYNNIRMITLLKTLTYGTKHFKGNKIVLDEFNDIKKNLSLIYDLYDRTGVVL